VHAVETTIQPSVLWEKLCLFIAASCLYSYQAVG